LIFISVPRSTDMVTGYQSGDGNTASFIQLR